MWKPLSATVGKASIEELAGQLAENSAELIRLHSKQCAVVRELNANIFKLNEYYRNQFVSTDDYKKKHLSVREHAYIVGLTQRVNEGKMTSELALQEVDKMSSNRKTDVLLSNIFKAFELLFWIAAAVTSYAFCIGFGIPVMFFNPLAGILITAGTAILMLEAASTAFECIEEFQSSNSIEEERVVERDVISFFAKPKRDDYARPDSDYGYDYEECALPIACA